MTGNWEDYIERAKELIEGGDLARAECFVTMQAAILKFEDDPAEVFKCGVLFGAAKGLEFHDDAHRE